MIQANYRYFRSVLKARRKIPTINLFKKKKLPIKKKNVNHWKLND
jgi:hypothetical protein